MKNLILFFFLIFSIKAYACKCHYQSFGENYAQNDFIAEIEIVKTYDIPSESDNNERLYKADIKILKLYKGNPVSSILIKGKIGQISGPSCEIEIKNGEKMLVYLSSEYNYTMSSCTPKTFLDNNKINIVRKALDFMVKNKITNSDVFYFADNHFKNFKNLDAKNFFAVYKIKVNSKSKANSIQTLQSFGSSKDFQVTEIIRKKFIFLKDFMTEVKNEEVVLVLFYEPNSREIISNHLSNF